MHKDDFMSRFDEIFEFDFSRASVRRAGNRFIDYSNCAAEKEPFATRLFVERIWTCALLTYQEHLLGKQLVGRLATRTEDRDQKIDYFNIEGKPIGHKIRTGHVDSKGNMTEMDAICVRFQPCHGIGHPKTVEGRDYVSLVNHTTVLTKTAVFDPAVNRFTALHEFSSDEFLELALQLDKDWGFEPLSYSNRKWVHPNGSTVQWVKKEATFYKYIYYVPFRLFKTGKVCKIPASHGEKLRKLHRLAWDHVVNRYINIAGA